MRPDDPLAFAVQTTAGDDGTVVVSVKGDVDLEVSSLLADTLEAAGSSASARVVVDLSEATFFDSSALHALVGASAPKDGGETRFAIACGNPSIYRVLEITGVPRLVPVYATLAEASGGAPRDP